MSKTLWKVTAQPVNRYWNVQVDGLGGATQARSVKEIEEMARDYIEGKTDAPADSFDVSISIELPKTVKDFLANAQRLRDVADEARKESAMNSRQAAKALKAEGLTVRDIGSALGISFQRAQQLIKS